MCRCIGLWQTPLLLRKSRAGLFLDLIEETRVWLSANNKSYWGMPTSSSGSNGRRSEIGGRGVAVVVSPPSAHKVAERVRGVGPLVWGSGDGKVGCASRRRCAHQVTCRCHGASGPPAGTRSPGQGIIRRRNSVMHAPPTTPVRSQTDTNRRSHPQHQKPVGFSGLISPPTLCCLKRQTDQPAYTTKRRMAVGRSIPGPGSGPRGTRCTPAATPAPGLTTRGANGGTIEH